MHVDMSCCQESNTAALPTSSCRALLLRDNWNPPMTGNWTPQNWRASSHLVPRLWSSTHPTTLWERYQGVHSETSASCFPSDHEHKLSQALFPRVKWEGWMP